MQHLTINSHHTQFANFQMDHINQFFVKNIFFNTEKTKFVKFSTKKKKYCDNLHILIDSTLIRLMKKMFPFEILICSKVFRWPYQT